MTLEKSWELKTGDKVEILEGCYKGKIGFITFIDRIFNEEPLPVTIPDIHNGWQNINGFLFDMSGWHCEYHYSKLKKIES